MRLAAHSASTELAELRIVLYSSRTLLKRSFTMESVENSRNNRGCHELLAPTMMTLLPSQDSAETHPVQVSAFSISSKSFLREAMYVFPNLDLSQLTVVNTMQRARVDLVKVGEDIEDEKDRLILVFFSLAKGLCDALRQAGHWADYIDPCSGLPVCTESQNMFNEVDCAQTLLGYRIMNAGCCKIILHPQWGSSVYPASIFTTAPKELVLSTLHDILAVQDEPLPNSLV